MRTTPLAAGAHLWSTPLSVVARGRRAAMVGLTNAPWHRCRASPQHTHALHGCTHNTNARTQARLFSTARRLVPIADRVLVKRVEHKTQTAGGIYLPTEQKVNEADVVAVGPGAMDESGKLIPMEVAVGARFCCPSTARRPSTSAGGFHLEGRTSRQVPGLVCANRGVLS